MYITSISTLRYCRLCCLCTGIIVVCVQVLLLFVYRYYCCLCTGIIVVCVQVLLEQNSENSTEISEYRAIFGVYDVDSTFTVHVDVPSHGEFTKTAIVSTVPIIPAECPAEGVKV
jgi:hypothetical protein